MIDSPSRTVHPTQSIGAFARAARSYQELNVTVVPCGGEDGKRPLVKWRLLKRPCGERAIDRWEKRFPEANIGIVTQPSNLTVVDIDDRSRAIEIIDRCGETPVVALTPSGGLHLFYRHSGERSINAVIPGVDVKAAGGFVVSPPSINPISGRTYTWLEGGPEEFCRLPPVKPGELPNTLIEPNQTEQSRVLEGQRNNVLFRFVLRQLASGNEPSAIMSRAEAWNDLHCVPPLCLSEVDKIVMNALKYHAEGRNWVGGEPRVVILKSELSDFQGNGDALMLWAHLRAAHGAREEPFAIAPKAMEQASVISGWSTSKIRRVRSRLIELGRLEQVHIGGKGLNDPSLFRLCHKGSKSGPNIIRPPLPRAVERRSDFIVIAGGKIE